MVKALLASLAACSLLLGCGSSGEAGKRTECALPEPGGDEDLLPEELALQEVGTLVETTRSKGFVSARIVSETKIVELYPPIARSILDNGYEILSGDNEGFEAEIFFSRGKHENGNIYMREGPCEGQVTLTLTYGSAGSRGKGTG